MKEGTFLIPQGIPESSLLRRMLFFNRCGPFHIPLTRLLMAYSLNTVYPPSFLS